MFHDVLHRLEAKVVKKNLDPIFQNFLQLNVPHWGQFSEF